MNIAARKALLGARALRARRDSSCNPVATTSAYVQLTRQQASDAIRRRLEQGSPTLVARLGSVELDVLLTYLAVHGTGSVVAKSRAFVRGSAGRFWWDGSLIAALAINAGFFPRDVAYVERFALRMLEDLWQVDILGSWLRGERLVASYLNDPIRVRLHDLEPYYHENPWTAALTGKTVLVVHPYAESIERQYAHRERLFANAAVLPSFELKTIKAVQSVAETDTACRTWFDAYDHMCEQIAETDFDVVLVGCGAYGLPLAAHAKRLGKQAVHLGGALQILFGIKGRRWDQPGFVSTLYNEHWTRPLASERPRSYEAVEDGAYW
jgi:hypothetical protein